MATSRVLLIRRGDQTHRVALAAGATSIGRAADNHVVLDGRDISHYHARITAIGDGLQITDLGSGQGTRVNQVALPPRISASIGDADTIQVGTFTLTLQQNTPLGQAATLVDSRRPSQEVTLVETPLTPSGTQLDPAGTVALRGPLPPITATPQNQETSAHPLSLDLRDRERTLIGRLEANDLMLEHPTVSRFHARISRLDGAYYVEDLHSANGVFVNGARISLEEAHPLRAGDTIHIGAVKLIFRQEALEQIDESHDVWLDALHLNQPVGKGVNLLQDISLSIHPREFTAVVGASGAGKSTLLNALTGFQPARGGSVLINGDNLYQNFDAHRANLGYVPQEDIIHADLTVERALDYAAQLRLPADTSAAERKSRVDEVIATLGLTERRDVPVRDLSGGQRKRVSIGVELLTKPGLFFLDEATSGLDPGTELQMMRLLRSLADEGQTVLLVTHATKNVALCDQVLFLARGGYLAWYGPPDEALCYFGVDDFDAIYEKLENDLTPAGWAHRYRGSTQYQTYVVERLLRHGPSLDPKAAEPAAASIAAGKAPAPAGGTARAAMGSWLRQIRVLSARYLDIVRRDRAGLALLFLVPVLLGAIDLLAWPRDILDPVAGTADRTMTMLFLATVMPFLVGSLGVAREIVKEAAIYRRERMVALRIVPYLLSKVWVALLLSLYSAGVLLGFKLLAVDLSAIGVEGIGMLYVTLALACLSGAMWGLLISALARREEQVMMLVVLVVVVQIVFSGGILPLRNLGPAGQVLGSVTSSKWVFQAEVAAVQVKQGDCDGAALDGCTLPGIDQLGSDAERRVLVNQVDERFRDVFGHTVYVSWAALLAIIAALFALLIVLQKRQDAT